MVPMRPGILGLLALPALPLIATAQTTVVTILDIGVGYSPFRASVVAASSTATTYKLACPPASNGCGYGARPPDITAVAGPSMAVQTVIVDSLTQFSTLACRLSAGTHVQGPCSRVGKDGTSSFTFLDNINDYSYVPVTVTGGLEKISQNAGQTTPADGSQNPTHTTVPTGSPSPAAAGKPTFSMLSVCIAVLSGFFLA